MRFLGHICLAFLLAAGTARAATYDFTYGGRLTDLDGKPYEGPVALRLSFFRDTTGTTPVLTVTDGLGAVPLQDGLFQVRIPFDAGSYNTVFPSVVTAVYVEITDLTHAPDKPFPRQQISTVPYAGRIPVDGTTLAFDANGKLTVIAPATPAAFTGDSGSGGTGGSVPAPPAGAATAGKFLKADGTWATPTGSVAIGSPVPSATSGSVLFVDASGQLSQSNANLFWDPTSNLLGLGTSSPLGKLHLKGGPNVNLELEATGSTLGNVPTISFRSREDSASSLTQRATISAGSAGTANLAGYLAFSTVPAAGGLTERMRITTTGNVGIGTTSPAVPLHVRYDQNFPTYLRVENSASLGNPIAAAVIDAKSQDSNVFMAALPSDYSQAYRAGRGAVGSTIGTGLNVEAPAAGQDIRFYAGGTTERMRIDAAGNVGISTTAPGNPLTIGAPSTADPLARAIIAPDPGTATSKGLVVQAVIGSGGNLLEVQTAAGTPTWAVQGNGALASNGSSPFLQMNGGRFTALGDGTLRWYASGAGVDRPEIAFDANRAFVLKSGVYDGASAVAYTLDTGANLTTAGAKLLVVKNQGATKLTIDKDGNVGIGSSSPNAKLTVTGNAADAASGAVSTMNATMGSATNHQSGLLVSGDVAPAAPSIQVYDAGRFVASSALTTTDLQGAQLNGLVGVGYNSGSGRIGYLTGVTAHTQNLGGGLVDSAAGLKVYTQNSATITDLFGIYVAVPFGGGTITNKYALVTEPGAGHVGVGIVNPSNDLTVVGSVCVTAAGNCSSNVAGTIYATTTAVQAADLAEHMPVEGDTLQPGDVVAVTRSATSSDGVFTKSLAAYQANAVGVVSTRPGVTLGSETPSSQPVALAGRVPVNVTLEGGPIAVGDTLVASSTPGQAMRAVDPSQGGALGIALSAYDGTPIAARDHDDGIAREQGHQVLMLVQSGPNQGTVQALKDEISGLKSYICAKDAEAPFCR